MCVCVWCVCVCMCGVCVYVRARALSRVVSLAALRVRFPLWSGNLVVSQYDTYETGALERN
jgi:hypothetical protein